ncbi:MAG: hypothetical protein AABX16_00935, partial [Nanoarchaeota archaeon]
TKNHCKQWGIKPIWSNKKNNSVVQSRIIQPDYPGDFQGKIGEYTVNLQRTPQETRLTINNIETFIDEGNNRTIDSYQQELTGNNTISIDTNFTKQTLQKAQIKYDMILGLIKEHRK